MFRVVLQDGKLWKNCIETISSLITEGVFTFGSNGVRMMAMDPSQIAMVDLELLPGVFEEYDVKEEAPICVDLEEMKKRLASLRPNDKLELSYSDNRLTLRMVGTSKTTFTMNTLEPRESSLKRPALQFSATVRLLADTLKDSLSKAKIVADNVTLEADQESFQISATGSTGDVHIRIGREDEALIDIDVKENAKAIFPLNYLSDMAKASSISKTVTIHLKNDHPLELDFTLGEERGKLSFLLAPRLESR